MDIFLTSHHNVALNPNAHSLPLDTKILENVDFLGPAYFSSYISQWNLY